MSDDRSELDEVHDDDDDSVDLRLDDRLRANFLDFFFKSMLYEDDTIDLRLDDRLFFLDFGGLCILSLPAWVDERLRLDDDVGTACFVVDESLPLGLYDAT